MALGCVVTHSKELPSTSVVRPGQAPPNGLLSLRLRTEVEAYDFQSILTHASLSHTVSHESGVIGDLCPQR